MGALTFACPVTRESIDPGITTDRRTFRMVREVSIKLCCPHCNSEHEFHVGDGCLAKAA